jgi:NYN domain
MSRGFPPRRLHLIDAENLIGCPQPTDGEVLACRRRYAQLVGPAGLDQCIVACSHRAALAVGYGWPGARRLWRSGPDGADLALLDVFESESVCQRFDRLVLGSGDGIFAEAVSRVAARGVHVTVVATRRSLARRLLMASHAFIDFDPQLPPALPAYGEAA